MCKTLKQMAVLFFMAILIVACGGGGGSDYSVGGSKTSVAGSDPQATSDSQIGRLLNGVFQPGELALSIDENQTLAPGGSLTVTASIVDDQENPYELPVDINFSSTFADAGLAEIEETKTTSNGEAVVVYKARGGAGHGHHHRVGGYRWRHTYRHSHLDGGGQRGHASRIRVGLT